MMAGAIVDAPTRGDSCRSLYPRLDEDELLPGIYRPPDFAPVVIFEDEFPTRSADHFFWRRTAATQISIVTQRSVP